MGGNLGAAQAEQCAVSNRLALGTAQFGLRYGIANRSGQVNRGDARTIVAYAAEAGLTTLDTAMAYGDSETRLGEIGVAGWQVISKLPALPHGCSEVSSRVWAQTRDSLRRLRVAQLHGLLLHRPQDLLEQNGPALYETLQALKERGAVEKIGVSIYDPDELAVLTPRFRLDIVQAHGDRVGGGAPAGYRARLEPVAVELAARRCRGAAPVPPGQPPGHRCSAHADIDDVRALNHPRPAGDVRLHPHRDGSSAGRAGCGRVSARAGRTARSHAAGESGRDDDAHDSGCAAH